MRGPVKAFHGPSEPLDAAYTPVLSVDTAFAHYFQPTMVTDTAGRITAELAPDLDLPVDPAPARTAIA
jgi:hypothetical protein